MCGLIIGIPFDHTLTNLLFCRFHLFSYLTGKFFKGDFEYFKKNGSFSLPIDTLHLFFHKYYSGVTTENYLDKTPHLHIYSWHIL